MQDSFLCDDDVQRAHTIKEHDDLSSTTSSIDDHSRIQTNPKDDHFPLRIKFMKDDHWIKTVLTEDHSIFTKIISSLTYTKNFKLIIIH